jgi:hypothetical protein
MSHPVMLSHWYHRINFIDRGDSDEKNTIIYCNVNRI